MKTLQIAALGLQQDLERLKLTSHNVANLSTPGYKRQIAVQTPFTAWLDVGGGIHTHTDTRPGKVHPTGNNLDVALPEGRLLLLEKEDGSQALSRQGSLQVDAQGLLRTLEGHKVLGLRGPISLRAEQRTDIEIDSQGQIRHQGGVIESLHLVRIKVGVELLPLGDGLYAADSHQWDTEAAVIGLRSGHLEQSNVMPSQEMVSLMSTTRHAETMVRLFQAADDMQATAIRRFGETS